MVGNRVLVVSKVCAVAALACFLLLPQAGCGNEVWSGLDLVTSSREFGFVQVMGSILILACVVALFVPDRRIVSALGAVAIVCLLLLTYRLKRDDWVGDAVEIKYGAFLTALGLLGTIAAPWLSKGPGPPKADVPPT